MGSELPALYICHYSPNADRWQYLVKHIKSYCGKVVFVRSQDASDSATFQAHLLRTGSLSAYHKRMQFAKSQLYIHMAHRRAIESSGGVVDTVYYTEALSSLANLPRQKVAELCAPHSPRRLNPSVLSLALKHRYALSDMILTNTPWALIGEDDIIFRDESVALVKSLTDWLIQLGFLGADPVYVDLAGGCNLTACAFGANQPYSLGIQDSFMYRLAYPVTRTTCCYLVNLQFAEAFLRLFPVPVSAIDVELTACMQAMKYSKNDLHVFWLEPPAFIHGSESGAYLSGVFH